jgi:hypothetical protein
MYALCYSNYEVYSAKGAHVKGGDAMAEARNGIKSVHAHTTASKEMYLCKPE